MASAPVTFLKGVLIPDESADEGYGYRSVDVTLADGLIAAVVPAGEGVAPPGVTLVDCKDKMLLPGTVNAHAHTSEHWARGMIKPLPLELWIHQLARAARMRLRRAVLRTRARAATRATCDEHACVRAACCRRCIRCAAARARLATL